MTKRQGKAVVKYGNTGWYLWDFEKGKSTRFALINNKEQIIDKDNNPLVLQRKWWDTIFKSNKNIRKTKSVKNIDVDTNDK